jgi:hypothetical protein
VPRTDLYVSGDVEADGPVPGPYSMLSFGLAVAGRFDGKTFVSERPEDQTFYAELQPIGDQFQPEAVRVSGLDRERLRSEGETPTDAMERARSWLASIAGSDRLVLVGYPLVYDWMWLYWYFERFTNEGSPFGHSLGLDMKTMYAVKAQVVVGEATKRAMPSALLSDRPHLHHALGDAIEQAEMFGRLFVWDGNDQ